MRLRSIYHIPAAALSLTLLLSSCGKKLEITPEVFLSPEQLYKDEAGATAGVTGIYKVFQEWKRSDYYFMGIIGTDEGKTTSFVPTWGGYWTHYTGVNSYNNLLTAQNDLVQGLWSTLYKGIANANVAIRYIPRSSASDKVKNQLLGEARFMRAAFYFTLVQFYGSVPMPTDEENPEAEANGHPKSSVEDIYRLITGDLQFGAEHLDPKGPGNTGRANKEAATALLGKVYLTTKQYELAESTLQPLLTATNVGLLDNYADLFDEDNENNRESLFEVQYSNLLDNTSNIANTLGGWHIANNYAGGGGHVVIPTDRYSGIFESDNDERKDASIRYVFYDAGGNVVDYSWWADVGKPHVKKFDITQDVSRNSGESSRNVYYLRYADVLLMYAEVENELNKPSEAMKYLDIIRERAGVGKWEDAHGTTLNQTELRAELLNERMRELGFEGWRWFDLKRTGNLLTLTKAYNPDATPNMAEKHLLLPLSAREFELNQALNPATDQNPGY